MLVSRLPQDERANIPRKPVQATHKGKGPMERLGEARLAQLMQADARKCNARMIGGGQWESQIKRQAAVAGQSGDEKQKVEAYLARQDDWRDRRQICAATGISGQTASNVLYAMVTSGTLQKRLVSRGSQGKGKIGQWRIRQMSLPCGSSQPQKKKTKRQIIILAVTHEWQTTRQIADVVGMDIKAVGRALRGIAEAGIVERGKRVVGDGGFVSWRKIGAAKKKDREAPRKAIMDYLSSHSWQTTGEIAQALGFTRAKATAQLSVLQERGAVEMNKKLVNSLWQCQWKVKQ